MEYEEMKDELSKLIQYGYEIYACDNDGITWFYIITPRNNMLYVQQGYFGGYQVTLEYFPTRNNGTGCTCHDTYDGAVSRLDLDTVFELENRGLTVAYKLNQRLYTNIEEAKSTIWKFNEFYKLCD